MRLLIVDDDVPTVSVIKDSIKWASLGIRSVKTAYSVVQAKNILEKHGADIVISDVEMPRQSGIDLLVWIREQGMDTEFILLTCHEKFEYAAKAIKLSATEYLTKPYDAQIMELSVKRAMENIIQRDEGKAAPLPGAPQVGASRQEHLRFWLYLYNGITQPDKASVCREIEKGGLDIDFKGKFCLVLTKCMGFEQYKAEIGNELFFYGMEDIHASILGGQETNTISVRRMAEGALWFITATPCEKAYMARLIQKCTKLEAACRNFAKVKITCCVGNPCCLENLPDKMQHLQQLIQQNTAFYGKVFTEDSAADPAAGASQILDIDQMVQWLRQRDKVALLNYLKEILEDKTENKTLTGRSLFIIKQEVLQAAYAYLHQAGVQATLLFNDESSRKLSDKTMESSVDMLRWVNFMLDRIFTHEKELKQSGNLIQQINAYIHQHYKEEMDRKTIAERFHLTPEYLAKLYKKRTGTYLGDYIRDCRVEQAKVLLRNKDVRVADVAGAVGFDNFSYFSTVFRKCVGQTPNEYRAES